MTRDPRVTRRLAATLASALAAALGCSTSGPSEGPVAPPPPDLGQESIASLPAPTPAEGKRSAPGQLRSPKDEMPPP